MAEGLGGEMSTDWHDAERFNRHNDVGLRQL
jgi:hypothetical protein